MSRKTDEQTYLKLVARTLEQIKMTPKDQPEAFKRLKRKAEKYLAKAKALHEKARRN